MAEYIQTKEPCKSCVHKKACETWMRYLKTIHNDDDYSTYNCPDYLSTADVEPVQEWISVKDRLPEAGGYVVCIAKRNPFSRFMPMVARIEKNGWVNPITEQYISDVTHWMSMPPLPKGE